ncbi:hypothetical protein COOONC_14037 [Cooperia oncophora]
MPEGRDLHVSPEIAGWEFVLGVCDTRLVGDNDENFMVREWSLREAKVADLEHLPPEVLLDGNQVWASLPVIELRNEVITPMST